MIKLNGTEHPFETGSFLHEKYTEELTGGTIADLLEQVKKTPALAYTKFIYTGMQAGYRREKKEMPYSLEDVEEMLMNEDINSIVEQLAPEKKKKAST